MNTYKITIKETGTYKEKDNSVHEYHDESWLTVRGSYSPQFIADALLKELKRQDEEDGLKTRYNVAIEVVKGSN